MQRGFTLIEIAIVMVVIGLIAGGVLLGQSLIRAAQLRAVGAEYERYTRAIGTFHDQYIAWPGDMSNAMSFWGTAVANGNGNGKIEEATAPLPAAGAVGETYQFWVHLASAGLVDGNYTGKVAGNTNKTDSRFGINVPKSRLKNAGWSIHYQGAVAAGPEGYYPGSTDHVAGMYGNFFAFGGTQVGWYTDAGVMEPREIAGIDTKYDDGKPMSGHILVVWWDKCAIATSETDVNGTYNLANRARACGAYFTQIF